MIDLGRSDRLALVCRRHPDVVAVWEGPDGTLGLLLRQTLLPMNAERGRWFHDTRRAARAVTSDLRAAGIERETTVLQWRTLDDIAAILTDWKRRYLGDAERLAQLTDIVAACVIDRAVTLDDREAVHPAAGPVPELPVAPTLLQWYRDMSPCWLGAEPRVRRRLILKTHRWIVERVLAPIARGDAPATDDLAPSGRLVWMLVRLVPATHFDVWRPWIRLTLADLTRALSWPPARRTDAWIRWLFVIPYSIPVTGQPSLEAPDPRGDVA